MNALKKKKLCKLPKQNSKFEIPQPISSFWVMLVFSSVYTSNPDVVARWASLTEKFPGRTCKTM